MVSVVIFPLNNKEVRLDDFSFNSLGIVTLVSDKVKHEYSGRGARFLANLTEQNHETSVAVACLSVDASPAVKKTRSNITEVKRARSNNRGQKSEVKQARSRKYGVFVLAKTETKPSRDYIIWGHSNIAPATANEENTTAPHTSSSSNSNSNSNSRTAVCRYTVVS